MKHYLITRFNLTNDDWREKHNADNPISEDWLDKRIKIFETYCFPSVKNQANTDFDWLVLFDSKTPDRYRKNIADWKGQLPNFRPLFINGFLDLNKAILNYINDTAAKDNEFIITTRLDNDDAIHVDFIKTIQENFKPQLGVIDLIKGYQLILKPNGQHDARLIEAAFNPFISVISRLPNFKSVLSEEHHYWKDYHSSITIKDQRLWIQFVHGGNVLNRAFKFSRKSLKFKKTDFGFYKLLLEKKLFKKRVFNFITSPIYLINKIR